MTEAKIITCPYCQQKANLVSGCEIYPHRSDLFNLKFWLCKPCAAYVGCHKEGAWLYVAGEKTVSDGTVPLGRLANAELRAAKSAAHAAFDPIWKSAKVSRRQAYKLLAEKLAIVPDDCHIGLFDVAKCNAVVAAAKDIKRGIMSS